MRSAALVGGLAVALVLAWTATADAGRRKRRKPRRPKANAPQAWAWPPSPAMERQGERCLERLREHGLVFREVARPRNVATPIIVPDMTFGGIALTPKFREGPFVMDCHLADALIHVGDELRALGVVELRFSTIHDYRRVRVNGRRKNVLSRHALGLAVDVFEVVTRDGHTLVVEEHYATSDTLPAIERAVDFTGEFRTLLTPAKDPISHDDHFHFEARVPTLPRLRPPRDDRQAHKAGRTGRKAKARGKHKAKSKRRAKARRARRHRNR